MRPALTGSVYRHSYAKFVAACPAVPDVEHSNLTGVLAMAVPPGFIEDLRQRVPLSDIIGRRVTLVRKGRRFSGLCPVSYTHLTLPTTPYV